MGKGISLKLLRAQQREPPRPSRRLDQEQMSKAVRALSKHINTQREERRANGDQKPNLLASNPEDVDDEDDAPINLILTTKIHIVNKKKLKPGKITIPHTLYSPNTTMCLITTDPHRAFKHAIAHPSFPESLRRRITRVIGVQKILKKYKSYESRRQLHREHDIFLADDRILPMLPHVLGKAFYRSSCKRPIPVNLAGTRNDRQNLKEGETSVAQPTTMANEIERTLSTALVHLSPSTSTSIRIGRANWDERLVVENIEAVVDGLIRTFISRKWRNIRALHVKGPTTAALPVYMTKELWVDEKHILDPDAEAKALGAPDEDDDDDDTESDEESEKDRERTAKSTERKKKRKRKDGEATDGNDKEEKKAKKKVIEQEDDEGNADRSEKERKKKKERVREENEGVEEEDDEGNADRSEKERKKKKKRVREEDEGVDANENEKKAKKKVKREKIEDPAVNGNDQKIKKAKKEKDRKGVDDDRDKDTVIRKERLKKQKAEAMADVD